MTSEDEKKVKWLKKVKINGMAGSPDFTIPCGAIACNCTRSLLTDMHLVPV